MKKILFIIISLCICSSSFANEFSFRDCKISNVVIGNYVINVEKNVIEVELKGQDGTVQNFSDKIKTIETNKIVSEKIKSAKGENFYYQYFLNSESKSVIKLEYIKQSGIDMDIYKLNAKRISYCIDVSAGWDKKKIDEAKITKEQKEILKAQEKLKKEQEKIFECQGDNVIKWKDCKG